MDKVNIGDKIQTNHMPGKQLVAIIKDINSSGVLLQFTDGSEAVFPVRYIERDFEKVQNG